MNQNQNVKNEIDSFIIFHSICLFSKMQTTDVLQYVNQTELVTYQEIFSIFDKEDTGTIPISDLHLLVRGLGHCPTEQELKEIVQNIDSNQESTVSFPAVVQILAKRKKQTNIQDQLLEAFQGIQNEAGNSDPSKVSVHGVKKYLTQFGQTLSDMQVDQFQQFLEQNKLKQGVDFNFRDLVKILAYGYLE